MLLVTCHCQTLKEHLAFNLSMSTNLSKTQTRIHMSNKKDDYRQRASVSTHFGLPWVRPWDNRGKCYMGANRSNALQHTHLSSTGEQ